MVNITITVSQKDFETLQKALCIGESLEEFILQATLDHAEFILGMNNDFTEKEGCGST